MLVYLNHCGMDQHPNSLHRCPRAKGKKNGCIENKYMICIYKYVHFYSIQLKNQPVSGIIFLTPCTIICQGLTYLSVGILASLLYYKIINPFVNSLCLSQDLLNKLWDWTTVIQNAKMAYKLGWLNPCQHAKLKSNKPYYMICVMQEPYQVTIMLYDLLQYLKIKEELSLKVQNQGRTEQTFEHRGCYRDPHSCDRCSISTLM